jgi:Flp pilus assembly protein TadG
MLEVGRRVKRFFRANEAVAAVEFALILPLLLTLYLGSLELSQLITVDRRVQTVTGTVGDLVSQQKNGISCATLTDFFDASRTIMADLPTTSLQQTVTEIYVDANGVAKVMWSKPGPNPGPLQTVNATYVLDPGMDAISHLSYVIVSETWYPYTPLLGLFFHSNIQLYRKNFYVTRYGASIATTAC